MWIAVSVYVLVAIIKKRLALPYSLYTLLQLVSLTLFEKRPILQVSSDDPYTINEHQDLNQLELFDL